MRRAVVVLLLLAISVAAAGAEVIDAGANGFSLRVTTEIDAPIADVYRALTDRVGRWWDPVHSYSGDAANFTLEARPGGCFCETVPTGGVQHMVVVHVEAPRVLLLRGALGPLASLGADGAMAWTLDQHAQRTQLQLTYNVGGYLAGGLASQAPPVDAVLTAQVMRLKRYVETGRPE